MISKELKNDFREMIFGTFCAGFEDVIYSWEKNHFLRKWAFPEMDGNHFFPENAQQPPKNLHFILLRFSQSLNFIKEIPNVFEGYIKKKPLHFIKVFPVIESY